MHEPTRQVKGNLQTFVDELDDFFLQLGESRTGLVHRMRKNSAICSYKLASWMKDPSMIYIQGEPVESLLISTIREVDEDSKGIGT